MARLRGRDIQSHPHAKPNGTPLWATAMLSSIGAACTLFFVQWMTTSPTGSTSDATLAQAEMLPGTTPSKPSTATDFPGQSTQDDSIVSNDTEDRMPKASVSLDLGSSVPQKPTTAASGNTSGSTDSANQAEVPRQMVEKAFRGDSVEPTDLAAGNSQTEDEKKRALPNTPPEESVSPQSGTLVAGIPATTPNTGVEPNPETVSTTSAARPVPSDTTRVSRGSSEKASSAPNDSGTASDFQPVNHAWADVKESLRIPVPAKSGDSRRPQFSAIRPEFIQFNRSLLEVRTGRSIAKLPAEFSSDSGLVSSDGAYVLRYSGRSGSRVTTIYVHPVKSLATFTRIDCTRFRSVNFIQLLTSRLLLVVGETSSTDRWTVWNIETGEEVASFKIARDEPNFGQNYYAVNPAGNKLLVAGGLGGGRLFDVMTGQISAQLESVPKTDDPYVTHGRPEFSPDGKEIAAIVNPSQIAVWSEDGRLIQHETVPGLARKSYQEVTSFHWMPDSNAWFVDGRQLIDRTTSMVVWELLPDRLRIDRDTTSCVLSQNQVLVISGENEDREFTPVRIPWEKIREKLQAIRTNEPVELKAGVSVSVVLDLGELRFSTSEQVNDQLKQSARQLLKNTGLQDAPDQSIQLILRHAEVAERNRLGRGDPGQRASDTKILTVIELLDSKTNSLYWQGQHEATGWLFVRENQTEQTLRDAAFAEALKQIGRVVLPTRVFPGDRQGLPIQTPAP